MASPHWKTENQKTIRCCCCWCVDNLMALKRIGVYNGKSILGINSPYATIALKSKIKSHEPQITQPKYLITKHTSNIENNTVEFANRKYKSQIENQIHKYPTRVFEEDGCMLALHVLIRNSSQS